MAANIAFLAGGYLTPINNLNNSGLGFFGSSFGQSVNVGSYQSSTYITDGNGLNQGAQTNNCMFVHPLSGTVQNGTILNCNNVPNYQSTLNIHFTNSSACRTTQGQLYIYDRVNTNNFPSGVTCAVCPVIHPDSTQNPNGSGGYWQFPAGSSYVPMSIMSNGVAFSPGQSGYGINGGSTQDQTHDFYCMISASPNSIGAKTYFGLLFSVEFL